MLKGSHDTWLLLVDSRRARLLRGHLTRHARPHVQEEARLDFQFQESEHGRPSPRINKDGHSYASRRHENDQLEARFAREVSSFVQNKVDELQVPRLFLFAPAKFLGMLRKSIPARLADRLVEHEGEFAHLSEAQLAVHPEVARLIDS
jgi:protein required for attachment to host cells